MSAISLKPHKQIIWSVLSRNSLTDKKEAREDPHQARGFGEHVCDDRKLFYWCFTNVANCPQMLMIWFLNFVEMKDLWPRSPSGDTAHLQLFPCLELSYTYSVLSFRMNKEDILVWERVKEGKVSIVPVSGSGQLLKDALSLELLKALFSRFTSTWLITKYERHPKELDKKKVLP